MLVSRSVGVMPNPLDTREIFYSNLLLLGFDPVAMESREKIPFNRDMFVLPNKKAMEIVMYFLFSKLNPKITHEEFRGCWPVKNKVDEQKFRKTCYNWVSKLAKEESDTYFPRVVQSLFHSPGGDRFYNFLLLFTMYVLKVVMHRDHSKHVSIPTFPSKSIHNHSFSQVMSKSLQVQTSLHRKRFLDLTQYSLEVQQHWKSYSIELNKENRSLKNKKRDVENCLQKEISSKGEQMAKSIAMSNDYQKQVDALQRTQQLQKVRALWKGIEDFSSEHNPQVVDSILTNRANQHHLDATDVEVKIPDLLLREFERDIHMKRISNTYISGKLNLLSLMQLWNLSLTLIKDKIQRDSVPSFDESSPKIKNDIHTHQALLSNVESLRSTVTKETIPDLKQSVEQLKSKIYQDMIQLDGTSFAPHQPSFNVSLGLLPATPPVSFSAAETSASQRITSFEESLKRTPAGVSTPDVINAWSESLKGRRPPAQKVQLSKPSKHINDRKTTRSQKVDQPTQIPKPKNIPTGIARNQHRVGKAREDKIHKTLPKKGMSSSAAKQGPTARKNEVISPLALDPRSRVAQTELRKVVHKSDIKSDLGRESATANVANQIIGALSLDKPDSGSSSQSSRSSTPQLQAVDDPMKALDETAFVSHDMLTRTPAPKKNYSALRTAVNDVQELDKDSQSTSKSQHQRPHANTGLFETILNQARQPPTAKTVRAVLFSSPEKQDYHQYDSSFRDDSPPQARSSSEINSHRNQPLLSPFAFETPKVYKEDDKLKQDGVTLLTPFSFVTPLTHTSSSIEEAENEFTPLRTQVSQERGPNTEHTGTPKVDTLINFTPAASRERGPNIEPRGTPKLDTLIHFTPATSQAPGIGSTHKSDELDSSFNLSRTFEEKLTLSKETNNTRTPGLDILTSPFANTKTMSNGKSRFSNNFLGPQIDLLEPTVFIESLNLSDDGSGGENSEPKRSPFGAVDVSDDDGEGQDPLASSDAASQPTVSTTDGTRSFKEMKESDLMNRLKKIKEAQSYDFSYLSPGVSTSNDPDPLTVMSSDKEYTDRDVAMETMQANCLDQIQEAHSSQQVKPGADIQVNLELYKGTDEVMTPLTISSKDSPDNLIKAFEENVKSNISTPTSMLSERFLQESPGKENNSNLFFSLDSPGSPDTDPIKIISTNGLSLPEGAPSRRTPEKGLDGKGATPLGAQIGPSSSVHLWNTGPSPISTSLKNDDKIFWLTSNGMTSKGLPSDRRLSYDDFLNESVDTSFLVPGTPYKPIQGSHGAPRTPVDNDHAYKPPDNSVAIETTTSPAVAQLIEF